MIYRETNRMSDLLTQDRRAMQIVNRFGIPMGVGDKTIDTVCREHGIHTPTFLAIVNNGQSDRPVTEIDLPTLQTYLRNAHTYFMEFLLPRLRRQLIEAINPTVTDNKIPLLIVRYFDEYVQEIRIHIQHENEGLMENHATDDRHITEEELKTHCAIEDDILRPALERSRKSEVESRKSKAESRNSKAKSQDELSEREQEVLTLVVQGLLNKEIADRLHLSLHTVIAHRKNISRKLNIHSTAGLTIYAIVNHLIDIESVEFTNL